jgi:hypothetical protein
MYFTVTQYHPDGPLFPILVHLFLIMLWDFTVHAEVALIF